jgi:hypothetical protein
VLILMPCLVALTLAACGSRTDLLRGDRVSSDDQSSSTPPSDPTSSSDPKKQDPPTAPSGTAPSGTVDPKCQPKPETCNGVDDDCNGAVDDVPSVPCPGGGFSYCIGGHMSECPKNCDVCQPGSERICFTSFCTGWGAHICAADGSGFGACREVTVPAECKDIALKSAHSKELEQCCIDNGYCCTDEFDLDNDGVKNDFIGQCDEVACGG